MLSAHPRITRGHSCLSCRQRKVKCDGQRPCSSCVKNGVECAQGNNNTKQVSHRHGIKSSAVNERLLQRLRRCEEVLQAHGIQVDDDRQPGEDAPLCLPSSGSISSPKGQMIVKSTDSRYVENWLWKGLTDELQDSDNLDDDADDEESQIADHALSNNEPLNVFNDSHFINLHALHPPIPQLFQLWQVFLNNVNPIVKLFHAPSVQQMVLDAAANLGNISRPMEVLLFAIYLAAATSMDEESCQRMLGADKSDLVGQFSRATKQALTNAEFLKSTNTLTLQALTLYLLATRHMYEPHTLWLFTGIATRIARAMGLHREASLDGFSVFNQEIRRRLWWQILILDSRSAQLSGVATNADTYLYWDTKRPLNLNDSDLFPSMQELPAEYDAPTEMLFCEIRFEIGDCMRKLKALEKHNASGGGSSILMEENQIIDELETRLKNGYLKKCDSSIPFHLLAIYLGRSSVSQMRLASHIRQRYSNKGFSFTQAERDRFFTLGLEIIGYDNLAHSNKNLQPYLWHVAMNFPFEAFILVLTELLTRVEGELVSQAWMKVNEVYQFHPELITASKTNDLVFALNRLTVRAWEKRVTAARNQPLHQQPIEPASIIRIRALRGESRASTPTPHTTDSSHYPMSPPAAAGYLTAAGELGDGLVEASGHDGMDPYAMDISQVDWQYWQTLIDGQGDFFRRV